MLIGSCVMFLFFRYSGLYTVTFAGSIHDHMRLNLKGCRRVLLVAEVMQVIC